jgi:hypothetical protein
MKTVPFDNIKDYNRINLYEYYKHLGGTVIIKDVLVDDNYKRLVNDNCLIYWNETDQFLCDYIMFAVCQEKGYTKISFDIIKKWILRTFTTYKYTFNETFKLTEMFNRFAQIESIYLDKYNEKLLKIENKVKYFKENITEELIKTVMHPKYYGILWDFEE